MLKMIAFGFQRAVVVIVDFPPTAPGGDPLHHLVVVHRQVDHKGIMIQYLTIFIGGRECTPVPHQRRVAVPEGEGFRIAIGIDFVSAARPALPNDGAHRPTPVEKIQPVI